MNNRIVKFKVWDKSLKEWQCGPCEYLHLGDDFSLNGPDKWYKNCWVFLQYIGIQDKNNKEIYEGDIVTCSFGYSPDTKITGVVEFSLETLSYVVRYNSYSGNDVGFDPANSPDSSELFESFETFEDLHMMCNLEVIGNVFENGDITPDAARPC